MGCRNASGSWDWREQVGSCCVTARTRPPPEAEKHVTETHRCLIGGGCSVTQKSTGAGMKGWGEWDGGGYTSSAHSGFENVLIASCESAWRATALLPTCSCHFCSHMCLGASPAPCYLSAPASFQGSPSTVKSPSCCQMSCRPFSPAVSLQWGLE